jgi:hypothetical protein
LLYAGAGVHGGDEHEAGREKLRVLLEPSADLVALWRRRRILRRLRNSSKSSPLWARLVSPGRGAPVPSRIKPASKMVCDAGAERALMQKTRAFAENPGDPVDFVASMASSMVAAGHSVEAFWRTCSQTPRRGPSIPEASTVTIGPAKAYPGDQYGLRMRTATSSAS